jgi:hypothetical protein
MPFILDIEFLGNNNTFKFVSIVNPSIYLILLSYKSK